tara:strand:- start:1726 stop:1869 length:144 start_codon:yes stop_codon:yes gene_type:complete
MSKEETSVLVWVYHCKEYRRLYAVFPVKKEYKCIPGKLENINDNEKS